MFDKHPGPEEQWPLVINVFPSKGTPTTQVIPVNGGQIVNINLPGNDSGVTVSPQDIADIVESIQAVSASLKAFASEVK